MEVKASPGNSKPEGVRYGKEKKTRPSRYKRVWGRKRIRRFGKKPTAARKRLKGERPTDFEIRQEKEKIVGERVVGRPKKKKT